MIVLALVASVVALWLVGEHSKRAALVRIGGPARTAIFQRAHDDLIQSCRLPEAADGLLHEHCVHQANFVLQFPECDSACERDARAQLPRATR